MSKDKAQKDKDVAPFTLPTEGGFQSRSNDVFANLGHIEAKHNAYQKARSGTRDGREDKKLIKDDPNDDPVLGKQHHDSHRTRPSSNKPSTPSERSSDNHDRGFKRPRNPAPRARRRPDNQVYPDGFTYFNMNDVPDYSMSDKSNTAAALTFLSSLESGDGKKKQKIGHDQDEGVDVDGESSGTSEHKIIFNKPRQKQNTDSGSSPMMSSGRQGCVTMPEYIVGQKPISKKTKPKKTGKSAASTAVMISHVLQDDEDDQNDDQDDVLHPTPIRTVFSGCIDDDEDEPMNEDNNRSSKTHVKSKMGKKRVIRSHKVDDDEDPPTNTFNELDGVD